MLTIESTNLIDEELYGNDVKNILS